MQSWVIVQLMILLTVANTTPLALKGLLGDRFSYPIDGRVRWTDGQPLFGSSKTIRGVMFAVLATSACASVVGLDWRLGGAVGSIAMAGDLFASFVKRRLKLPPGSRATGIDQVPESLLPLLVCIKPFSLTTTDFIAIVSIFVAGEMLLSRLFYRLGLRDRPY